MRDRWTYKTRDGCHIEIVGRAPKNYPYLRVGAPDGTMLVSLEGNALRLLGEAIRISQGRVKMMEQRVMMGNHIDYETITGPMTTDPFPELTRARAEIVRLTGKLDEAQYKLTVERDRLRRNQKRRAR